MTDTFPLVALVSGANRGIGLAIADGLATRGVRVLLGARDLAKGEAAAAALAARGRDVRAVQLDTTDDASVAALARRVTEQHGRLDILINNAGIGIDHAPGLSVTEKLEQTLAVNVTGTARLTEAMLPLLRKAPQGRIVNVSSELASFGLRADPDWPYAAFSMPTYQASKAAVNALTVSYAQQLADTAIKVNAICPGYTATEATHFMGTKTPEQAAVIAVMFALLDAEGPSGAFVNDSRELPW
ncbi:SDR family oxidoreductase [Xanthobacter sediminis]|uniref:SDR family oxidoreductase n=1 Tax=Xanthobacter sediminis TaxID=3119926 RepID=UPI00372AFDE7